jgi:chorismate synthase
MSLRFLTAGESHGPALVAILEGIPSGLEITPELINLELKRRQAGYGAGPRMKLEDDAVRLLSGVMGGMTIGSPIALVIENRDHTKWRNQDIPAFTIPRPGHADLAGAIKYGYDDLRPSLERASARETAARVAVGAICKNFLGKFGIQIGGYVTSIGGVEANLEGMDYPDRFRLAEKSDVRCPDEDASGKMREAILNIMQERDTLGGVVEIVALDLPPGLGSHVHWDRRLEARLGAAVLSVQAIKGVEIGQAFLNARLKGTQAQDAIQLSGDELVRDTQRSGGTEGGISTGEPLIVRAAMKPIATTLTPQQSVNLATGEQTQTAYERSDFCPVPRAVPILEAMVAFVLADALNEKLGGDSIQEMLPRYSALRRARLSDLKMANSDHTWWKD